MKNFIKASHEWNANGRPKSFNKLLTTYFMQHVCFCVLKIFKKKWIFFYYIICFKLIIFGVFILFWCAGVKNKILKVKKILFWYIFKRKLLWKATTITIPNEQVYDKENRAFALTLIYHNWLFFLNYFVYIATLHFSSNKKNQRKK